MRKTSTLRRQLITWLAGPLVVLWSVSIIVDYDIAKRFVNLAYDRELLEAALDIGRQVKVIDNRIYVDLPDIAAQMLQTRESDRLYYLVTGPDNEFIKREHATGPLDIAKLARDATTEWVPRALERNIDLGFDGPDIGINVDGDAFLLKEMLNNLLDNAIRYTQPGGQVTVRITADTHIRPIANCHIVGIQLRLCLFVLVST